MLAETIRTFIEASGISLSLADAQQPDLPLVAANGAFSDLTGYSRDEVVGRNCRFLQPDGGAGPVRERIREFLFEDDRKEDRFLLANVRKDATPFLNLLYLTKIRAGKEDRFILGSQFDFTRHDLRGQDGYDATLRADVRELGRLTGEMGMVTLGTFRSLASSAAIIAEARLIE